MFKDATPESRAEVEGSFAKAVAEEKLAQVKTETVEVANVTVSSIGRKLPARPSWMPSDEMATISNQLTAAAFADVPGGKK